VRGADFHAALARLRARLFALRLPEGHWEGRLASSALATATASFALALLDRGRHEGRIARGLAWIAAHGNADGGWGDTTASKSNVSTTALCWAALGAGGGESCAAAARRAEEWLAARAGGRDAGALARALAERYGEDRTFAVPILTMCALAGRLGPDGWRVVPTLPFELAALPRGLFRFLRLSVVSYALPALIAMGQVRDAHLPAASAVRRALRAALRRWTRAVLERMQPSSGGYLEAAPLTAFVAMSLAGAGRGDASVARRAEAFLVAGQREDGSWAIDSNLAMWVTTLAVNALGTEPAAWAAGEPGARARTLDWILAGQHREPHPYTGAAPGGWAWTDLPGGVPDADDTAGALLALRQLDPTALRTRAAGALGIRWLLALQNADGGMPTFCRGWGRLPFDRGGADLTAHALRAWSAWLPALPSWRGRLERAIARALRYLEGAQRSDGAWVPLWFGNEDAPGGENPTYGTARVVTALAALDSPGKAREMCLRGAKWLQAAQHPDGGFGGAPGVAPTFEETAVAGGALAEAARAAPELAAAALRAGMWLAARAEEERPPAAIGLYFARLWYHEDAYPLVFAADALAKMQRPWG